MLNKDTYLWLLIQENKNKNWHSMGIEALLLNCTNLWRWSWLGWGPKPPYWPAQHTPDIFMNIIFANLYCKCFNLSKFFCRDTSWYLSSDWGIKDTAAATSPRNEENIFCLSQRFDCSCSHIGNHANKNNDVIMHIKVVKQRHCWESTNVGCKWQNHTVVWIVIHLPLKHPLGVHVLTIVITKHGHVHYW